MQSHLIFQQYVLYFVIYSVAGYIAEVIYCSILDHTLVNRGFLYGPWIPIYGFGGLAIQMATGHIQLASTTPIHVFVTSMVSASLIEYIGSWLMESCFGIKLWDYSKHRFNLHGRICLLNSTLFGFGGIALTYLIRPTMMSRISHLSSSFLAWSSNSLLLLFTVDFVCSVHRLNSFREGLRELERLVAQGKENLAILKSMEKKEVSALVQKRFEERYALWKRKFAQRNRRILEKFPSMQGKPKLHLDVLIERLREDDPLREFKMKVLNHD